MQRFADITLADFAQRLADKVPSPGGGAVAAVTLAHGAALGAMVLPNSACYASVFDEVTQPTMLFS